LRHAGGRVGRDVLRHVHGLGNETQPAQFGLDDPLGGRLLPHRAGCGNQPFEEAERLLGQVVDRPVEGVKQKRG